jgi:hypothetical protein
MPWLTDVVFKQAQDEPLTKLPRFDDGPRRIRFRHLVHVYTDQAVPENTAVQSITFDTIDKARQFAAPDYRVTCVAITYPEDSALVPPGVVVAPHLQRVVTDIARFKVPRALPLLFDVLRNGMAAPVAIDQDPSEAEFIVLTNSDIHLQPPFYRVVAEFIRRGYDAMTITRRTIDVEPTERAFTPLFMAEAGHDHPGFDCFVFPARMMQDFGINDCCCGAGAVMRSLLFNLVAHARRFLMLTQARLTFHLGNDVHWQNQIFADYIEFNLAEARALVESLATDPEKAKRLIEFISAHEPKMYQEKILASLSPSRQPKASPDIETRAAGSENTSPVKASEFP